jgi:hypothetical protein
MLVPAIIAVDPSVPAWVETGATMPRSMASEARNGEIIGTQRKALGKQNNEKKNCYLYYIYIIYYLNIIYYVIYI